MPDYLESGFFAREGAWHGKGSVIQNAATAEDALTLAGQNWTVRTEPIMLVSTGTVIADHFATVREDTGVPLGVVGRNYEVIQNSELYKFLEPVIEAKEAVYETAGVLKGGKRVWALAKLPQQYVVAADDVVQQYLLIATSHDGSLVYLATWTDVRVVCWNTLSVALNLANRKQRGMVTVRHTHDYKYYLEMAHQAIGLATANREAYSELFTALAHAGMSNKLVNEFVKAMFPSKAEQEGKEARVTVERTRADVAYRFEMAINNPRGAEHSGWTAYNALTDWIDHAQPRKKGADRQDYSWFGGGDDLRVDGLKWLSKNLLEKEL